MLGSAGGLTDWDISDQKRELHITELQEVTHTAHNSRLYAAASLLNAV